jgi:hypothetical protein
MRDETPQRWESKATVIRMSDMHDGRATLGDKDLDDFS